MFDLYTLISLDTTPNFDCDTPSVDAGPLAEPGTEKRRYWCSENRNLVIDLFNVMVILSNHHYLKVKKK